MSSSCQELNQLSPIARAAFNALRDKHSDWQGSFWNLSQGSVVGPLQQIPRNSFSNNDHNAPEDDGNRTENEAWFAESLKEMIQRTESFCDILHMAHPDGGFLDAFREALEYLDQKKKPIVVRMMFANYYPYTPSLKPLMKGLTQTLSKDTKVKLWVGGWRSYFSWPHAKLIAIDGRYIHTGGYNMWHDHYLGKYPVFDLSVELQGDVTQEGHAFANAQWDFLAKAKQAPFRLLNPDWGHTVQYNCVTLESFPSDKCNVFPPRWDNTNTSHCRSPDEMIPMMKEIPMLTLGSHVGWGTPGCSDDAIVALFSAAQHSIKIINQDLGPMRHIGSNLLVESNAWPVHVIDAIAEAIWKRGVTVDVILSNHKSRPGGWGVIAGSYSNGWFCEDSAARIFNAMRRQCQPDVITDEDLRGLLGKNLRLCYLRTKNGNRWVDGSPLALHSKHFIVDDTVSYVGSQNLYTSSLAEWGVLFDDQEQTETFLNQYWNPMFKASFREQDCNIEKVFYMMEDVDRHSRTRFKEEWRPIVYRIFNVYTVIVNALAWRPSESAVKCTLFAMLLLISLKMMGSEQIGKQLSQPIASLWRQVVQLLVVLLLLVAVMVWREKRLQRQLTSPPIVHNSAAFDPKMEAVHQRMSHDGLMNDIKPSLFFGTNRWIATLAGFIIKGPKPSTDFLRFRQLLTMQDQATIALDWELPPPRSNATTSLELDAEERKRQTLDGPISQAVVLVLHGIGNSTTTGYMRSLMRSCAEQGWIAVGMNYRGCGGSPVTAPFGYNGAYTGDLRTVVKSIASRMTPGTPLMLVGHSIGANLVTKYLGEEGRCGTLSAAVVAGVSLANPCDIRSDRWSFPMTQALNLVAKKILLQTIGWYLLSLLRTPKFRRALGKAFVSFTLEKFDTAVAPILLRNDPQFPFTNSKGYRSADEYWEDAGSYQYARHVTVPLLQITSQDDFLVHHSYNERLPFYQNNPNLLLVETKTGGHLGWYEATSVGYRLPKSWAERATVSYLLALVSFRSEPT